MRKPFLREGLPEFRRQQSEETVCKTFSLELITPMMGGDSESWVLHPEQPVRGQSVKGQLRFWWRTMQSESEPKKLLQKENEIWGGKVTAEGKEERIQSPVKIAVLEQAVSRKSQAALNERGFAIEGDVIPVFVAFPVTSAIKNDKKEVLFIESLSFTLQVSCPASLWPVVEKTLKLWVLFGGIGARTRRGCGSLYCEELMAEFKDEKDIYQFVNAFQNNGKELDYPRIHGAVLAVKSAGTDTAAAWRGLITSYSGFRQDRRPNKPTPGRSYWPEPDAIRTLTRQQSKNHKPEHPDGVWFPRAAFGLPIITKFNTRGNGMGDPDPQVELAPVKAGRWPSPVILKALRLPDGKALRMALVLKQAFPEALELKQGRLKFDVPVSANPFAPAPGKKMMKTRQGAELRQDETLYQALFRELGLEEVK
ncbi:CRISPR-associated protein Cmr1 [Desulfobotulus alkaliphilus]|uniref:CRISPR-associated protein Cmr1 n=1 Tax=Desulfobotulus alkaliphilus TaxID=622671 RepID=A0A562R201_9BACT|nr:type III-B CRISPR module RAMP protein Cmr1 [Desulfobotulus alkaliphilus]TWI62863.1 CRISPR-associated protein Cmr1 [Desulfobotulus alkaliphilus]